MKITYVIPTLGKGGAEDLIVTLANKLVRDNDVKVLILRNVAEDDYNISRLDTKVEVSFLYDRKNIGSTEGSVVTSLETILRGIIYYFKAREYHSDIIHLNLTMGSVLGSVWQLLSFIMRHKLTYIETFHTNLHLLPLSRRLIFYFGFNLRSKLVYQIHEPDKSKITKYLLNKNKLSFIGFGVESHIQKSEFKDQNNSQNSDKIFTLLTVGRMRLFEKRIGVMIETLAILIKTHKKNVNLVLGGDGKDMAEIKDLVHKAGLQKSVKFLGYVDNPEKVMLSADLYLCAMVGDETGVSGVQAGQLKLPIIGIQTIPEYESAPIIAYDDPSDLAGAITKFIDDPIYSSEYAALGQKYIEKRFSADTMVNEYRLLYSSI
tara:strand:+ start:1738 stop:2862 length:1125 start_codon:yes stop_codon:yes gene_type:complete